MTIPKHVQSANNNFISNAYDPKVLDDGNFHYYIPRSSIRAFIVNNLAAFHGRVLDLGCGFMPYRELILSSEKVDEYIPVDINSSDIYQINGPIRWDAKTIPLGDQSVDTVVTTELFEHLSDPAEAACEVMRVLRPAGLWIGTVPFIWPVHEAPYDYNRFTPYALKRLLEMAGASEISIKPLGGMDASLAQVIALWLYSKPRPVEPIGQLKRRLLLQFIRHLIKIDKLPDVFLNEALFTGLGWTSIRPENHDQKTY